MKTPAGLTNTGVESVVSGSACSAAGARTESEEMIHIIKHQFYPSKQKNKQQNACLIHILSVWFGKAACGSRLNHIIIMMVLMHSTNAQLLTFQAGH